MISVSGKEWRENKINHNLIEKINQKHNFSKIVSKLVISRNFDNEEIHLIENNLELTNIFKNNIDFIEASKLVTNSINNKEKICILGDYDVDGSTSTALLIKFFEYLKHSYFYYIPDREKDGYGPSVQLFEKLILKKPKLVIMVDCGSSSTKAIDFLNKHKIKSLVIDHHEIYKPYPKANVIINPKKNNGYSKYDYLCATSLTYFFLEILKIKTNCKIRLRKLLIYVLLATICDVMPLRKLNKLISIIALKEFRFEDNQTLRQLFDLSNKKNKINISDLGFLIGPILNSGGRLGKSNYATELLSSNNLQIIKQRSEQLISLNIKRRTIENIILDNLDFKKIVSENENAIIHYDTNISEGLLGIIAARLKEYFNKPAIVLTKSNNLLKGSARSVYGYNIGKTIKNLLDKDIILNGGGHNMAAGFTLKEKNLNSLKNFINNDLKKNKIYNNNFLRYDSELSVKALNKDFVNDINKIGPFGNGNFAPIFLFKDLKVIKYKILNKKYISCILKSKIGSTINSILFDTINNKIGYYLTNYKKYFNVVGQIDENFYNNKKNVQLIIKDLIL